MKYFFNSLFGSFFRTVGRILAYLCIGIVLSKILNLMGVLG